MIIIQGEMGSGKSKLAMDLLKHKKKGLYLILDKDHSVIQRLKKEKMNYTFMTNCLLMDIKYRILERGGLMNNDLDYVVVDSLNKIKDDTSYLEKIKYLQEVEKDFGLKIILTHNILRMLDKIPKKLKDIDGVKIIEVRHP
jgi:deoxyadenosine/deoxycytidine kinase